MPFLTIPRRSHFCSTIISWTMFPSKDICLTERTRRLLYKSSASSSSSFSSSSSSPPTSYHTPPSSPPPSSPPPPSPPPSSPSYHTPPSSSPPSSSSHTPQSPPAPPSFIHTPTDTFPHSSTGRVILSTAPCPLFLICFLFFHYAGLIEKKPVFMSFSQESQRSLRNISIISLGSGNGSVFDNSLPVLLLLLKTLLPTLG